MRLARELGYTLKDLFDSLDDGEIELWYEFDKTEPLSNPWLQTGRICSTVANYAGKIANGRIDEEDFMPIFRPPMTVEEAYMKTEWFLSSAGFVFSNEAPQ